MKKLVDRIKSKPFLANVLTLMSGTVIAQFASIIAYPIITRLYTPANFGVYDLFVSIFAILSTIASFKYEQAIVIPKDKYESYLLLNISVFFSIIFSIIVFVVVFFFNFTISKWLGNIEIRAYLYLVPIMVFITGIFYSIKYYALRIKAFKDISKANASQSILSSGLQILFGLFKPGSLGLIGSQIVAALPVYLYTFKKIAYSPLERIESKDWRIRRLEYIRLIKEYIEFPKYSVAATLANSLVLYSTSIFIFKVFNAELLGYISLANRLLTIPLILIGTAVGDVFLQKASSEIHDNGSAIHIFNKTCKTLVIICVSGSLIGYFLLKPIFIIFFGTKWSLAGYYSSILIFMYAIRLVASPLSNIFIVYKKQRVLLLLTLFQLLLLLSLFGITIKYNIKFDYYIYIYVISQVFFYILLIFTARYYAKGNSNI